MIYRDQLKKALSAIFSSDGWLVNQGGHHLPEQLEYAHAVADWLTGEAGQPLALIEGDTGTGKTLGYLFPIILNWVYSGERSVIATHTISLQNQLIEGDLELVERYLLGHNLPLPRVQQRLGMRHYVDPDRAEAVVDLDPGSIEKALFLEWANETSANGSGLLGEWLELYGQLPEGVTEPGVCITPMTAAGTSAVYERDKRVTFEADVIVSSHMMVLLEARIGQNILGLSCGEVQHLIFDEADQVPLAAEQLSGQRLQPREAVSAIGNLVGHGSSHLNKVLRSACDELREKEGVLRDYGRSHDLSEVELGNPNSLSSVPESLSCVIQEIQEICRSTGKSIKRSALGKDASHLEVHKALDVLDKIAAFGEKMQATDRIHALAWSPKLKLPSFLLQRANPAFFVSNLWRKMPLRVAFTSATLGVARSQSSNPFVPFMAQMAVAQRLVAVNEQLSPAKFGSVRYVLADKDIPKPVRKVSDWDDEGIKYSDQWLAYTAKMIRKASEEGPTLVLTGSYQESAKIGQMLSQYQPIVHRYGHSLIDAISKFQQGDSRMLITPAAWQGISIRRGDGSQLIEHLVITKIPFVPPNPTAERLSALLSGRRDSLSPAKAATYYRNAQINQALIKLRQGFGRAIRKQTDQATIWICDPRFPRPGEDTSQKRLASVIPERFSESYQDATIFVPNGEDRQARKPVPAIVEEALNL